MNSRNISALLVVATCASLPSCSRYDAVQSQNGHTLRIDHLTGDVAIVSDTGVFTLPPSRPLSIHGDSSPLLVALNHRLPQKWPAQAFPSIGVTKGELATRCRAGVVLYRLTLTPVPRRFAEAPSTPLLLELFDEAGFDLERVPLLKGDLSNIIDSTGRITSLEANSSLAMDSDTCAEISGWSLLWYF
jgi:hypothetical protein